MWEETGIRLTRVTERKSHSHTHTLDNNYPRMWQLPGSLWQWEYKKILTSSMEHGNVAPDISRFLSVLPHSMYIMYIVHCTYTHSYTLGQTKNPLPRWAISHFIQAMRLFSMPSMSVNVRAHTQTNTDLPDPVLSPCAFKQKSLWNFSLIEWH